MISFVIPSLRASVSEDDMPVDLTEPFLASLEYVMLAQAQEGVWQRAVLGLCLQHAQLLYLPLMFSLADNYKNGIIAKLAMKVRILSPHRTACRIRTLQVASLYSSALMKIKDTSSSVKYVLPSVCSHSRLVFPSSSSGHQGLDSSSRN